MLRDTFVNVLVAPYFELSLLANVKHVFKNLKIAITSEQDLKTLQSYRITVQRVIIGNVIDFGEVGDDSLVKSSHFI